MQQGTLQITAQNLSICQIANHQNFYADHTCNIEDCKSKYRQCCSMCFDYQLHIRDTNYDLLKIYSNTKILEIISQTQMAYMDQYDEFLADYYYAQLINSSLYDLQQLYYIEKWLPSFKQAIIQLSYSNYRTQLEAKNMSLNEFLCMQRRNLLDLTQFIIESFQNLTNSITDEQFKSQIIPTIKLDFLVDIMENIITTKKYQNKKFNKNQQNLIQLSLDELFTRDPILGQEIVKSSNEIYNEQIIDQFQEKICEELKDLEIKIQQDPNNDQLYFQKGINLLENNNVKEAISSIQKAIQINPESIYLKKLGIIIKDQLGNNEQAINFYNYVMNLISHESELYNLEGTSLVALKKFEEEIELSQDALDYSHHLNLYYLLGNALLAQLKYQEAIEVCEWALKGRNDHQKDEWNENYRYLYIILVQCLEQTKQYENCIIFCNQAIQIYKNEYIFYKIKGISLLNLNEDDEAKTSFQTAVLYNSSLKIEVLQIQGEYFFLKNNFDLAQKYYKTLIKEQPYNSNYYKQLVSILESQEKYDEALKALKQAIRKIPEDKHLELLVDKINYAKFNNKKLNKQKNQIHQWDIKVNNNQNQIINSNKNNENKSKINKKNNQSDKYIDEEQYNRKNKNKEQFEETPTPDDLVKSKYIKQGKTKKKQNIRVGQFEETQTPQHIQSQNGDIIKSQLEETPTLNVLSIIQIQEDLVKSINVEQSDMKEKQNTNIGQFEETPTPVEPNALDSEIPNYKQLCQQGYVLLQQNKYSKALEKFEQALDIKPDLYKKTQSKEQILAQIMESDQLLEMCDKILQLQEIM